MVELLVSLIMKVLYKNGQLVVVRSLRCYQSCLTIQMMMKITSSIIMNKLMLLS